MTFKKGDVRPVLAGRKSKIKTTSLFAELMNIMMGKYQ